MKRFFPIFLALVMMASFAVAEEQQFVVKMEYTAFMPDVDRKGLYTGEVENGVPSGYGVFTAVNSEGVPWHYIGEWVDGEMQGEGGQYWDNGSITVGRYKNNSFVSGTIVNASEESQYYSEEAYIALQCINNGENPTFDISMYESIDYKSLARNPEDHLYKLIKVDGTIVQVLGSRKQGYNIRVATKDGYDDVVYVFIANNVGLEGNLLEDDKITVYGMFAGDCTYESAVETEITIPSMQAFRVDLK